MIQKSLDLSGKISGHIIAVLESISAVAASLHIPFFVCGALARDIILHYGFNIDIMRATEDVDLGVWVEDWNQFKRLTDQMIQSKNFENDKEPQRFYYKGNFPVDIVPFGKISQPEEIISWPDCDGIQMNTLGFAEAYNDSESIRLKKNPEFIVKFASLRGLAAMKLISWKDQYPLRSKDARDFEYITRNYIEADNLERVYSGADSDISEGNDPDYELMSAKLLGRDVAKISNPAAKEYIKKILNEETGEQDRYKFIEDMRQGYVFRREDFAERLKLMESFKLGFLERKKISC